jgi:hypothetical protein
MSAKRRSTTGWRLNHSKTSFPAAPRAVGTTAPVVLTAVPDRSRRLSDGAIVEASIRARVLGIPLLRLDAAVVLVPAGMTAPSPAPYEPPAPASARSSSGVPSTRSGAAPGHGLAEAVRSINEGAELLAEVRRNGSYQSTEAP